MNTFTVLGRSVAIVAILSLAVSVMVGQNVTNTGTWTNTGTLTTTNFTNSGASAAFTNSGGSSLLRIKSTLTTNASSANPQNFDVSAGEVRYMGNAAQTINGLVKDSTYNNLSTTGAGSSTKTLSGDVKIAGTLTSDGSGVIVSVADKVLTVLGSVVSANSGAFTFTGGTVNYGGGAQSIFPETYGTLGATAAGNKTMTGNITVNTALNLTAGNFQINGDTLDIAGTIATTSGTLEGSATSQITLSGTGAATLPSVTNGLGTLLVNRTGATDTVKLGGSLALANALTLTDGDLHVGSAQTLTLSGAATAASGTLSSESDGTVNYAQASPGQSVLAASYGNLTLSDFDKTLPASTVNIAGAFSPGGTATYAVTNNTIVFNGGTQNIPAFGYNNLTTAGGAVTKTMTGNITVGGDFVNGSGVTTNVQSNTLAITGSRSQADAAATMQFGANNGLVFTTGTVEYNGASQNITGNASLKYANLLLSGSGTKSVLTGASNTVHTSANLTVSSGITLDIASGGFLNVDLDLVNNGSITNAGTITVGL